MTYPEHPPRMGTSPLVVEIGLKEIYDLLVALNTNVQILSGDFRDLSRQGEDHETRLRTQEDVRAAPRISRLEEQVEALKATRWPLPALAALVGVAALVVAVIGLLTR